MTSRLTKDEVLLQRKVLRLRGYDYSRPGTYFVTTNTHARRCILGDVVGGVVRLSEIGQIAHARWEAIPSHHSGVELDAFVVMPNHIHGLLHMVDLGETRSRSPHSPSGQASGPKSNSLSAVIGAFKSGVSRRVAGMHAGARGKLWQSGYQDHIVRTDGELDRIRQYINANPANWRSDPENPDRTAGATQASPPQEQVRKSQASRRMHHP
jgi:REP element-mobilizing transposase RayT